MTYHHSDEIADLSDAMRSAQEWQEIAETLERIADKLDEFTVDGNALRVHNLNFNP